jgi:uncharacterized protein YqjF (DUF2071 family)
VNTNGGLSEFNFVADYPESPKVTPLMLQRWHEITFFHWSCEPALIQQRLPGRLQVDTFDGKGWISLTPFLLKGLRPPGLPETLGLTFPETNLRTYVIGPDGPAIWFFSLDAGKLLPVAGARATFGLPYFWADMYVDIGSAENYYFSNRGGRARTKIRIAKGERITGQSPLDVFLTARFRLYSMMGTQLMTAEVEHPPWQLNHARIMEFEENVRDAMRAKLPDTDFLIHHSTGVDTKIGFPHRCFEK